MHLTCKERESSNVVVEDTKGRLELWYREKHNTHFKAGK